MHKKGGGAECIVNLSYWRGGPGEAAWVSPGLCADGPQKQMPLMEKE